MKRLILAAAFCCFLTPAFAQDTTALATEYVKMPEVQKMISEMFSPDAMSNQFAMGLPADMVLSDGQIREIGLVMSEAMGGLRPKMEQLMISASSEVFSAGELQALIDFYSSEHGANIMSKMTPFMANVMGQLQPDMIAMQTQLMPEIMKILQGQ